MAGESPDRSKREKSSGETTEDSGVVAPPEESAENAPDDDSTPGDARDSASAASDEGADAEASGGPGTAGGERADTQDAEGEADDAEPEAKQGEGDEGDARLKSAVAAWVARTHEDGDADDTGGAADGADEGETEDGRSAPTSEAGSGQRSEETSTGQVGTGGDAPTAMFGVVRPEDRESDEAAAERAERLTSAFFGAPKKGDAARGDDGDSGDEKPGDGQDEPAKPVDQPTTSFRTDAVNGSGKSEKSGKSEPPEQPKESGQPKESEESRGSEQSGKPGKSAGAGKGGVDQPTAVFRAPDPAKAPKPDPRVQPGAQDPRAAKAPGAEPKGGSGAQEGGDDKPRQGEAGETGKTGDAESPSERTSQFVPLKSADTPRTPAKPLPPAAPARPPGPPPMPPAKPAGPPGQRSQQGQQSQQSQQAHPGQPGAAGTAGAQAGGAGAAAGATSESAPEYTTQQPMPDPPPLDLLAQLTNTPPPAETPMRTVVRRVKIWTPLVLLLLVIFVVVQAVRPVPETGLSLTKAETFSFSGSKPSVPWPSEGQAVLDVDGLGSLGSYGEQKPVPIASVAKVMTAYVILRDHPVKKGTDGGTIPVDQKAEDDAGLSAQNESTVEVKSGQKISEREAINAIMIASANNVARLLARWDAGSEAAFVKKMNDAAKDLGMKNSTYTDPSGLKEQTVSTAADQVKLGKKVMDIALFREVVRQSSYKDGNGKTQTNWNRLVPADGVVGIKTGTTTKAGGNLLFAAEKEIGGTKQLIIGAVLGQYKPSILDTVLAESKKLMDTARDALETRKIVKKGEVVGYVDDQLGGETPVVATKDVTAVGWPGLKVKIGMDASKGGTVPHTGKAGDTVGVLTAGDGPGQVRVPVALQNDLTEPGFGSKITRVS